MTTLKKNFSINFIYQLLNILVMLITTPYIARILGPEKSGIYSYYFSVVNYFCIFSMLGINHYGNRSIAYIRNDKKCLSQTFSEIYSIQITITFIVSLIYIAFVFLCDNFQIALIQGLFLVATLLDINWFFFGLEKFSITVTRNLVVKIISLVGIFLFVKNRNDLYLYTGLMAGGQVISNLILLPYLKKYISFQYTISWKHICQHMRPIIILFIPVVAISLYNIMDKIMLGIICSKIEVGYYEYSEKILQIPNAFINAAGTVMLPHMSHMSRNKEWNQIQKTIEKSMQLVMMFSFAMLFGILAVSKELILVLLGSEYIKCIVLIELLSPIVVIKAWANVIRTQYLIPFGKDKIYVASVMLGASVNVIFNILFIPQYGAKGAVLGTVLAELIVMMYQTISVHKTLKILEYFRRNCIWIMPGVIMYIAIIMYKKNRELSITTLAIEIVIGTVIYLAISYGLLNRKIPCRGR